MNILGIESSCDETAASVVVDGKKILSSVVASQVDVHHQYGGVVPELASRMHVEAIQPVVNQALTEANLSLDEIDGIAATRGPGLVGALLVGFTFAKAMAWSRKLPLAGVNHLEAHIYSLLLSDPAPQFPFIALVVSGGHTNVYHVTGKNQFELMGQTRDDAAGEAFDKVAKMMGIGYPGGPIIEKMAKGQDPKAIRFPRSLLDKDKFDFSFSGLKSAVARYIHQTPIQGPEDQAKIAACFQAAVIDVLCTKLIKAAQAKGCDRIGVSGGVSANRTFVAALTQRSKSQGIQAFAPPVELCGDNAAMVAARGFSLIQDGDVCLPHHDVFSRTRI